MLKAILPVDGAVAGELDQHHFARIDVSGTTTAADILWAFGPPATVGRLMGCGDIWSFRWRDGDDMGFYVYFDPNSVVRRTQQVPSVARGSQPQGQSIAGLLLNGRMQSPPVGSQFELQQRQFFCLPPICNSFHSCRMGRRMHSLPADSADPDFQPPTPLGNHRLLKQWVALLSIWLAVSAALTMQLLSQRVKIESTERERLTTQARVIEENLSRQIRGANAALAGVRYELSSGDLDADQKLSPLRLKLLCDAMPGVRSMVVMDRLGTVIDANQKSFVNMSFSDRPTFRIPAADHDPTKLYVSPPFKSPVSGVTISLGKVMLDSSGNFSGVVFAALDPEYFDLLMGSVFYAPDMAAGIVHGDGNVVVLLPADPALLGTSVDVAGSAFKRHKDTGEMESFLEGRGATAKPLEDRMIVVRTMQPPDLLMNAPLVISISRLRSEVYAAWYSEVIKTVALILLALMSSAALLFYAQRRQKALEAIRKSVRQMQDDNAKRFELGLEGADLGLWDWEIELDRITINRREAVMLGFDATEIVHSAKVWQRLIHPDDWPLIQEKFGDLTDGRHNTFKIEYRMLHQHGEPVWVYMQGTVIERSADGRVTRILGTHLDVSQRRAAQAELNTTLKRLELAIKCGSVGLMDWNVQTGALVLNTLARDLLGIGASEALSAEGWRARCHPDDVPKADAAVEEMLAATYIDNWFECRVRHASGHYVWLHIQAEVVDRDAEKYPTRVMITYRDVSTRIEAEQKLQILNEQLAQLSMTDALTGIPNRRRFDEVLAAQWARNTRSQQEMALLMIDIDHFKLYNDHYGHQQGDSCLRQVAQALAHCVRRPDELLVRYGGEEFAVILFTGGIQAGLKLADRCLAKVREAAISHAASPVAIHITLSIGVGAMIPQSGEVSDVLVKAADDALYLAKRSGRDRACASPIRGL